jgi:type VI secretion system protein ImpL
MGISPVCGKACHRIWAFYITELPKQPQWKITPDAQLVSQSRQVLLQQIGRAMRKHAVREHAQIRAP